MQSRFCHTDFSIYMILFLYTSKTYKIIFVAKKNMIQWNNQKEIILDRNISSFSPKLEHTISSNPFIYRVVIKMYMAVFLKDLTWGLHDSYSYHRTTLRGEKGRDKKAKDQWNKSTEVIAWITKGTKKYISSRWVKSLRKHSASYMHMLSLQQTAFTHTIIIFFFNTRCTEFSSGFVNCPISVLTSIYIYHYFQWSFKTQKRLDLQLQNFKG